MNGYLAVYSDFDGEVQKCWIEADNEEQAERICLEYPDVYLIIAIHLQSTL